MNANPAIVFGTAMLLTAAAAAYADDYIATAKSAPRVSEMLQKRQENLLREQLVRDGRWDEVRILDDARVRRQRELQQRVVARMNDDLARSSRSDAPAGSAVIDPCDKESLRMNQLKAAQDEKNLAAGSTY